MQCRKLIIHILERQLSKPRTYHPTLMKEFSKDELELIFVERRTISDLEKEIEAVTDFINREHIKSPKILMQCCKMIYPNHINGGIICGDSLIEISTDLVKEKLVIEVDDDRKFLNKDELLEICHSKIQHNN